MRSAAARLYHWAAKAAGAALSVPFKLLPVDVRLELRHRLETRMRLDYRDADIALRVSTTTERRLRVRSSAKEPETVKWLERSLAPGDVLYDVGANVGAYSLIAATLHAGAVRVFAFEPGSRTFESLCDNIALNALGERISALPIALSSETGLVAFEYSSVDAGAARHPGLLAAGHGVRMTVMGYRLDDFIAHFGAPSPTHMKIDVDGSEHLVLRGATQALSRPTLRSVLVETTPGTDVAGEVLERLRVAGFARTSESSRGAGAEANWVFDRPTGLAKAKT